MPVKFRDNPQLSQSDVLRFWAKVSIRTNHPDACWEWTAATDQDGYGVFGHGWGKYGWGRRFVVSRVAAHICGLGVGPSVAVLHRCDNRRCCNPRHLFLGSQSDNISDMISKGRKYIAFGADNPANKLSSSDVSEIKARTHERASVLAAAFGVSRTTIYRVRKGDSNV